MGEGQDEGGFFKLFTLHATRDFQDKPHFVNINLIKAWRSQNIIENTK